MIFPRRFITTAERNLKITEFAMKLYVIWALVVVVGFGFFGIRPLYRMVGDKAQLMKDMSVVNKNLEQKVADLIQVREDLYKYHSSVKNLEEYMPIEPNIHLYMLDLVSASSRSGFTVDRFTPEPLRLGTETKIAVRFEGFGDPKDLVKGIEEMKRITQVSDLRYLKSKGGYTDKIDLTVTIFNFGEE